MTEEADRVHPGDTDTGEPAELGEDHWGRRLRERDEENNVLRKDTEAEEEEHQEEKKVKVIKEVTVGKYVGAPLFYSPYLDNIDKCKKLWVCEFCLKYMKHRQGGAHKAACERRAPPGSEIYRKGEHAVYEVDGKQSKLYCQNLCLLAKLFLDSKSRFFDIDNYIFYVLCEVDRHGARIAGYFSKDKYMRKRYNLACVLVLPPYQRKGYGQLLIAFSYELTRREGGQGGPEGPLSDLGRLAYRAYWARAVLGALQVSLRDEEDIGTKDIAKKTNMKKVDVISTLKELKLMVMWKGRYAVSVTQKMVEQKLKSYDRPSLAVFTDRLLWSPPEGL